jgi:hypothetical protein
MNRWHGSPLQGRRAGEFWFSSPGRILHGSGDIPWQPLPHDLREAQSVACSPMLGRITGGAIAVGDDAPDDEGFLDCPGSSNHHTDSCVLKVPDSHSCCTRSDLNRVPVNVVCG